MLRVLLRDSEAVKALFEKTGLFKSPELLEKYVIASEVTVDVLDLFLSRVFGEERGSIASGSGDLKTLWESFGGFSLKDRHDAPDHANESDKVEGLRVKVENLERQLCAVQRQLQMQGEVSQLAASIDGRLDEIARECERQVSSVSNDVMRTLSTEVSRLKEDERILGDRVSDVEKKATEAELVLRDEIQGEFKRLNAAVEMIPWHHKNTLYDPATPLQGIIAYLTNKYGGNVHEKNAVEVTASSCCNGDRAQNVVELGTNSFFCSNNEPNSWIRYDFKERRVALTSYSIRTECGYYPKSWVLEVSNDGSDESWEVVDSRGENEDLNATHVTCNFTISARPGGGFRFVRLRQTGKNHGGYDYLDLTSLELFGTLSSQ